MRFWKREEQQNNTLLVDLKKRDWGLCHVVEDADILKDSPLRLFRGKMVHYLQKDRNDKLGVINPELEIIYGETPADLYEALVCPDVEIVYGAEKQPWYKSPNMPYVIVIAIGVFLLFLLGGAQGAFG